MKQSSDRRLAYTILSISLLTVMAGAAMAPALGVIREHFASESSLTVQFIVSLPALFIVMTNLLFPLLCKWMRTRTLAIAGLVLYVAAGAGAFLIDNIVLLLVIRALLGISVGMIMPLSTGLLAYWFPPSEQARLMGLSAAMNQMGGVVATMLSGLLAGISWNYAFLVYLLALPALVLVILYLPNIKLNTDRNHDASPDYYESETGMTKARKKPGHPFRSLLRFAPSVVGMLLVMILFFIYPTNFAITSMSNGSISSNAITFIMVGLDLVAFVVGILFGNIMEGMRRHIKYVTPIGFLTGYACLSCGVGTGWLIIGSVLIGLANGVGVPYLNTIASIKGGRDAATTVMPLLSAALYLGQFISPLIVNPLSRWIGWTTAPYIVGAAIAVVYWVQTIATRRFQALPPRK